MKIVGGSVVVLAGVILVAVGVHTDATMRMFSEALAREYRSNVNILTLAGAVIAVLGFAILIWGLVDDVSDRRRQFRNSPPPPDPNS